MPFSPKPFYTRAGLALECGLSIRQIHNHTKAGTARLDKAVQKMPGVGIRYHGPTALKFIEIMRAKHKLAEIVPQSPGTQTPIAALDTLLIPLGAGTVTFSGFRPAP